MKKFGRGLLFIMVISFTANAQQKGFSYQAVLRSSSGEVMANQNVTLRFSLTDEPGSTVHYAESHTVQTTPQGIVNVVVGQGTGISGNYGQVPWSTGVFLKVELSTNGTDYLTMGSQPVLSVPLSAYADSTNLSGVVKGTGTVGEIAVWSSPDTLTSLPNLNFVNSLVVQGNPTANPDDPILEVMNSKGEVLFAVYQEGVRINIKDDSIKGAKGGFAVGGLTNQVKAEPVEYLRITPDSARIYIKQNPKVKGAKGGFAVGGLTNQVKAVVSQDLLFVNPDSARFYINENPVKGAKGGFAVGGLTNEKGNSQLMQLTKDNYLIGYEAGASITTGQYNSFLGFQAGKSNTNGNLNTFLGYQAGLTNQGSDNTFIGYQAGMMHTLRGGNVYIGSKAGGNALNGEQNIAIGESSGFSTTTGTQNIFMGYNAGYSNTNGYDNIFIGNKSGMNNTSGNRNMFFGNGSGFSNLTGYGNTFFGLESGYHNTDGYRNLFLGYRSGYQNINGSDNSFMGDMAGSSNTSGEGNTFVGQAAGATNTTGFANTALGSSAGNGNVTGANNLFVGRFAGYNIDGSFNTFVGTQSGANFGTGPFTASSNICLGYSSGTGLTDGYYNIFIGQQTGTYNGTSNVIIGHQAGVNNSGNGNVFIGYRAGYFSTQSSFSNRLYISNSGVDSTQALIFGRFDQQTLSFNAMVGIGTVNPDKELHVVGNARVEGDIYYGPTGSGTTYTKPDFVFTPDYGSAFNPLQVDLFIKENGHLPWMTKASDEKDGVNLTRMQFETVETVENLQLQIIQQQKEIERLKSELETIKALLKGK